ncbi:MAG: hypothetical protein IPK16_27475 [Anaerolineales bacterium]|nr:hypothetical protein [Anaerolineales bacterium]
MAAANSGTASTHLALCCFVGGAPARHALWQARQSIQTRTVAPVLFIGLLAIAVLVAYSVPPLQFDMPARVGLAVALALNLVGLFNMIIKQDIISQVIGLLIMDQGTLSGGRQNC